MIGRVISLFPINKKLSIYKWGVKLINKNTLEENETIYPIFDRCIPKSLYEKVTLKTDIFSGDIDELPKYQIISINNEEGTLELKDYGECPMGNVVSSKSELEEGYFYVKMLFVYKDKIYNKLIRTYSSPNFIEKNCYYEDFMLCDEDGKKLTYDVNIDELELSHKYINILSKVPEEVAIAINNSRELTSKLVNLKNSIFNKKDYV